MYSPRLERRGAVGDDNVRVARDSEGAQRCPGAGGRLAWALGLSEYSNPKPTPSAIGIESSPKSNDLSEDGASSRGPVAAVSRLQRQGSLHNRCTGLRFRVWDLGFGVWGLELCFRVSGSGFRVQSSGSRIWGFGFRV